jgi:hypothetical protein
VERARSRPPPPPCVVAGDGVKRSLVLSSDARFAGVWACPGVTASPARAVTAPLYGGLPLPRTAVPPAAHSILLPWKAIRIFSSCNFAKGLVHCLVLAFRRTTLHTSNVQSMPDLQLGVGNPLGGLQGAQPQHIVQLTQHIPLRHGMLCRRLGAC